MVLVDEAHTYEARLEHKRRIYSAASDTCWARRSSGLVSLRLCEMPTRILRHS